MERVHYLPQECRRGDVRTMPCQNPACGFDSTLISVGSYYTIDKAKSALSASRFILLSSYMTFLCDHCGTRMRVLKRHHPDDVHAEFEMNPK